MKKALILLLSLASTALIFTACAEKNTSQVENTAETTIITSEENSMANENINNQTGVRQVTEVKNADDALKALLLGNEDYLNGDIEPNVTKDLREDLSEFGQKPFAVIVTCSDSRVSPELMFNSNLGEVFVIRTAGNVVSDFELGSVEYGAEHLHAPLVLVLGHTNCGAVGATLEGGHAEGKIADIVQEIVPSVQKAKESFSEHDKILDEAIRLNVQNSISKLRKSEVLTHLEEAGNIKIVGGIYDITDGTIEIL